MKQKPVQEMVLHLLTPTVVHFAFNRVEIYDDPVLTVVANTEVAKRLVDICKKEEHTQAAVGELPWLLMGTKISINESFGKQVRFIGSYGGLMDVKFVEIADSEKEHLKRDKV